LKTSRAPRWLVEFEQKILGARANPKKLISNEKQVSPTTTNFAQKQLWSVCEHLRAIEKSSKNGFWEKFFGIWKFLWVFWSLGIFWVLRIFWLRNFTIFINFYTKVLPRSMPIKWISAEQHGVIIAWASPGFCRVFELKLLFLHFQRFWGSFYVRKNYAI
jgi:hypothetical protein